MAWTADRTQHSQILPLQNLACVPAVVNLSSWAFAATANPSILLKCHRSDFLPEVTLQVFPIGFESHFPEGWSSFFIHSFASPFVFHSLISSCRREKAKAQHDPLRVGSLMPSVGRFGLHVLFFTISLVRPPLTEKSVKGSRAQPPACGRVPPHVVQLTLHLKASQSALPIASCAPKVKRGHPLAA
jgi:hypothetical protein